MVVVAICAVSMLVIYCLLEYAVAVHLWRKTISFFRAL
ncbi:MAG: hypothetical protein GPOALKHO_001928 [Sodalis sp.]|nr:MAG: hypothetical protein GPOALKHO_001928 [Sodalis sp.]